MNRKNLSDIKPGHKGRVSKIDGEGALKRRLADMGITPGVDIFVRKVAPMGDPIEVNLRGYELSLRKQEAQKIIME